MFYFVMLHVKQPHVKGIVGIAAFIATYFLAQRNGGVDLNLMGLGKSQIMFWFNGVLGSAGTILLFEYLEQLVEDGVLKLLWKEFSDYYGNAWYAGI